LEVKATLLMMGLPASSIYRVQGMGSVEPLDESGTDQARLLNRRIEVRIVGMTPLRGTPGAVAPATAPAAAPAAVAPAVAAPAAVATAIPAPTPAAPVYYGPPAPPAARAAPAPAPAPAAPPLAAAPKAAPTAAPVVSPAAPGPDPTRFALGLGYPDLRARVDLGYSVDAELKVALEQGIQVYTGRVYWDFWDIRPFKLMVGAEGGVAEFQGIDSISGSGSVLGCFVGAELPVAHRLRLSVDVGPSRIQASSEGYSYQTTELIYNTALYVYLF
jgi:hypothetical protein